MLRRAVEKLIKRELEDKEVPGPRLLELLYEDLATRDLRALPLSKVTAMTEEECLSEASSSVPAIPAQALRVTVPRLASYSPTNQTTAVDPA